jgi:hypothetical protein
VALEHGAACDRIGAAALAGKVRGDTANVNAGFLAGGLGQRGDREDDD